jgi:phosphatidylserine decarboxylase
MMRIHREGNNIILVVFSILLILNLVISYFAQSYIWITLTILSAFFFMFILSFFRHPDRFSEYQKGELYSPADGKIVGIEEIYENEYFKKKMLRISVFMSIYNVHLNRIPFDGKVLYHKYHPGKYLVAIHPKSSELNERNTIVLEDKNQNQVLLRQIAGAVARRIRWYVKPNQELKAGQEMGFIRFGSRVDIFLEKDSFDISVKDGDKVYGFKTLIGKFKS